MFGVPKATQVFKPHLWSIATDLIKGIESEKTPSGKIDLIGQAIKTI